MKNSAPQLVIADADAIQEYIFSAHELKLIRGASGIQSRLMRELRRAARKISGMHKPILRASGGTLIARFPNEETAWSFRVRADQAFRRETRSATVTTAMVPDTVPFKETVESLYAELQAEKRVRPIAPGPRATAYTSMCQKCGAHPASKVVLDNGEARPMCASCLRRSDESREIRPSLNRAYLAEDFEDIARGVPPENYLAIAYFDIDRLGKYAIEHGTASPERYASLSVRIDRAVHLSLLAARRAVSGMRARIEVLLKGGDDAMVALPAGCLVEFLRGYCDRFDRFFKEDHFLFENHIPAPCFSTGVAIAHSHYPITEFRRVAKELLASAKRIRKQHSLDYEVITTSMVAGVLEARHAAETFGRRRSGKPWVLSEWLEFCEFATGVKRGLPASQVKALYAMAFEGPMHSELEYCYLRKRLTDGQRRLLEKALAPDGRTRATGSALGLWLEAEDGQVFTRAADLVEIQDFLHGDSAHNRV